MKTETIKIDFDVYQKLELTRRCHFPDLPSNYKNYNYVLRFLLGIDEKENENKKASKKSK